MSLSRCAAFFGVVLVASPAMAIGQFEIHLEPGPTLAANQPALDAFERAAQEWEARISTPIRINIDADLENVADTNVIGSTGFGSENLNLNYTQVRDAMAARSSRPGDSILSSLPTSAQVSANVPTNLGASFDNTTLGVTRANQKALGLIASPLTDNIIDGVMRFNENFAFDYDRTDGVAANKWDFETVAAHEIGHVLGFLSDTDDYDFFPAINDNATTMDLFRFTKAMLPTTPIQFTTMPRELRPGQAAMFDDLTNQWELSTGVNNGDGNQASHWKDDFLFDPVTNTRTIGPTIGIMDPTLGPGTIESISYADLRVMELIGYDTVPEPGGLVILIAAMLLGRRSR